MKTIFVAGRSVWVRHARGNDGVQQKEFFAGEYIFRKKHLISPLLFRGYFFPPLFFACVARGEIFGGILANFNIFSPWLCHYGGKYGTLKVFREKYQETLFYPINFPHYPFLFPRFSLPVSLRFILCFFFPSSFFHFFPPWPFFTISLLPSGGGGRIFREKYYPVSSSCRLFHSYNYL